MKIVADWGTSNLRAWLVDDQGGVIARHASAMGLRAASDAGFDSVLDRVIDELGAGRDTPALLLGMVGSQKGWLESPYTPTPAGPGGVAASAMPVPGRANAWIVGGVCHDFNGERPEVMRGEEVQVLGVLAEQPQARWVCLPGTHTKWVEVGDGAIRSFTTFMTGELFAWVTEQSLISTQIDARAFDPEGFLLGCDLAVEPGPFSSALFQLRTRYLSGALPPGRVCSCASGFLIGHEIASLHKHVDGPVWVCGAAELGEPYRLACERFGLECRFIDPERAAIDGLLALSPLIDHEPGSQAREAGRDHPRGGPG